MSSPFFELSGIKSGDSIEVPYGPWILWDQPVVQSFRANPMPAERENVQYEAWLRIVGAVGSAPRIVNPTDPAGYLNGDCNISLALGYDFKFVVESANGSQSINVLGNGEGRIAYLKIDGFSADSIESALSIARVAANSFSWSASFSNHVSVQCDGILVRSLDKLDVKAEIHAVSKIENLKRNNIHWMLPALRPFISIYVEGMKSQSAFYRFLCFFKICHRINSSVRSRMRKIFEKRGLMPPELNGRYPDDPIGYVDKSKVGVKYSAVVSEYQGQYRNAIAHLDSADKLDPFDLAVELEVRTAAIILQWSAYDLLNQMLYSLDALGESGFPLSDLTLG